MSIWGCISDMSKLDFALGELKCGRLPWFALEVWLIAIGLWCVIIGSMVAGWEIALSIDEVIGAKAEVCRGWMP